MFIQWESLAADPDRPFSGVERFISTFDAMHPRTVNALLHASDRPGAHYLQAYGQTETGPICLRVHDRAPRQPTTRRATSATPAAASRSGSSTTRATRMPNGTPGQVETHSPGRMRGYVGGGVMPADTSTGGRWATSAGCWRTAHWNCWTGSSSTSTVSGSLLEKEDRLLDALPELVELVLVKTHDGKSVIAVGCPRPGTVPDLARFRAAAKEIGMPDLEVCFWEWEAMPTTGSYKVRRSVLRQRLGNRVRSLAAAGLEG